LTPLKKKVKRALGRKLGGGKERGKTRERPDRVAFGEEINCGKQEDIEIRIHLENSSPEREKYMPNLRRKHPTVDDDGNLVVFLKKIDGQWFWNPFGW
jgi:hypothetical protein